MLTRKSLLLAGLACSCLGIAAFADDAIPDQPTVDLRLGAFILSDVQTVFRLDARGLPPGTDLDFADNLGGDSSLSVFRFDGSWNFHGRHGLDAAWYDIDQKAQTVLSKTIEYNGQTYTIGATVQSRFRTNFYKVTYHYTFYKRERHEVSGLLGAHIMKVYTSIGLANTGSLESFSVTAPLPSFGLAWKAAWTERFSTRASLQYFGISYDEGRYSGQFTDLMATAEYTIGHGAGLGLGYNRFDLKLDLAKGIHNLNMHYAYNGLLAYVFARF